MLNVSIHAPTGGATGGRAQHAERGLRFNSRAHGGRDTVARADGIVRRFQFTRPRGARPPPPRRPSSRRGFNSRAHGGRDGCAEGGGE